MPTPTLFSFALMLPIIIYFTVKASEEDKRCSRFLCPFVNVPCLYICFVCQSFCSVFPLQRNKQQEQRQIALYAVDPCSYYFGDPGAIFISQQQQPANCCSLTGSQLYSLSLFLADCHFCFLYVAEQISIQRSSLFFLSAGKIVSFVRFCSLLPIQRNATHQQHIRTRTKTRTRKGQEKDSA